MNIAIWGARSSGTYILKMLKDRGEYNVKYFIDSDEKMWGTSIENIQVISPAKLYDGILEQVDFVLVAFIDSILQKNQIVKRNPEKFGFIRRKVFKNKLVLGDILAEDKNIIFGRKNLPFLARIQFNVVDYCNLNCRACSHFSNLFEKGAQVPYEVFCKDLEQIARNVCIVQIDLVGGEPLLSSNIMDYIKYCRKVLGNAEIQLVTNGIFIPKQPKEFFDCCLENDIYITISAYRPTWEMQDVIVHKLEESGVPFSFTMMRNDFGKNINLKGDEDKYTAMQSCREHDCHFFKQGRLYKCPFEALGNQLFTYYDIDVRLDGGIDIYDESLDWNLVVEQIENKPVDACRYCGKEVRVDWACNQTPALADWIL